MVKTSHYGSWSKWSPSCTQLHWPSYDSDKSGARGCDARDPRKKKQLPISKTYNSNNWLLLLILRTKEGRKSKLSRKKCSRDFFFRFTGDLSQHINALEKLRDKFGKFTDKYVIRNIFFFFGFIICILFQINWINYFARKCIALHDLEIAHLYWYH